MTQHGDDQQPELFDVGGGATLDPHDELLVSVYRRLGRTLDDLPYTPEFDRLCAELARSDEPRAVLHRLLTLRKAGKLPRIGRAPTPAVKLSPREDRLLASLVEAKVGGLSRRDQLPYTDGFDEVAAAFNERAGRELSPHTLWRLIGKLAK
jgi:hypothetical protein